MGSDKKIVLKKILTYTAVLLIIGLIIYSGRHRLVNFKDIKKIRPITLAALSVLFLVNQFIHGFKLKIFMKVLNVRLAFIEWFGLISVQSFGNYLPLSGGVIASMAYLKTQRQLPVAGFISFTAGDTIIKMLAYGILGTGVIVGRLLLLGEVNYVISGIMLGFIVFGLACIFLPLPAFSSRYRIVAWMIKIQKSWQLIKSDKSAVVKCTILHIMALINISTWFYLIFRELGYQFDFIPIVILSILTNIIRVSSLLPGNFGLREAITSSVVSAYGLSFAAGLVVAVIDRLVSAFWVFLLGTIFSFVFLRKRLQGKAPANSAV